MTNPFKKAERQAVPLKILIGGASGSGKTFGSLLMMRGIVGEKGRIALIDTEGGKSQLYADRFNFDVMELVEPFTHEKYIEAVQSAINNEYNGIVIDSTTHEWDGQGGIKDQKDALDIVRPEMTFGNWGPVKKKHSVFLSAVMSSPIDVIGTVRCKQSYEQVKEGGKTVIRKLGLQPIQQGEFEYEWQMKLMVDADTHMARVTKTMIPLWANGEPFTITEAHGELLCKWRDEGSDFILPLSTNTKAQLMVKFKELGLTKDTWVAQLASALTDLGITEITKLDELSDEQGVSLYKTLTKENE